MAVRTVGLRAARRSFGDFGHEPAVAQGLILVERRANVVNDGLIETGAKQCTVGALSVLVVRGEREEHRLRRECRHLPTDVPAP